MNEGMKDQYKAYLNRKSNPCCYNCIYFTILKDRKLLGFCKLKKTYKYWFERCFNFEKDIK